MPEQRPIRSFVAIPVPEAAREAIGRAVAPLRGVGDVRWVPPEQYHLTLKFLGDATPEQLGETAAGLAETANIFSHFVVEFTWIGAFPRLERPRVVWLGMGAGATELTA